EIVPLDAGARDCKGSDVVVALGGDGTVLGGIRAAEHAGLAVLGIACGSLGMLTAVPARRAAEALRRFSDGDWRARKLEALWVRADDGTEFRAINDVVVVRKGAGQVKTEVRVDDAVYARLAGDGVVVATAQGSSAYNMAAGGPVLAPETRALVVTPLAPHGGSSPPLVVPAISHVTLLVTVGFSGRRVEVDGQPTELEGERFEIDLKPVNATLVTFPDQEGYLAALRRRGLIADSPRIAVRDERMREEAEAKPASTTR
ncbi:MAG: NAD(+)/NADH kinase, partial [Actinomycetota bacterium]|nr:NAD(+)/NADH kinase [Actinomycetota bacterium]